jgi:hypothetical protein
VKRRKETISSELVGAVDERDTDEEKNSDLTDSALDGRFGHFVAQNTASVGQHW